MKKTLFNSTIGLNKLCSFIISFRVSNFPWKTGWSHENQYNMVIYAACYMNTEEILLGLELGCQKENEGLLS